MKRILCVAVPLLVVLAFGIGLSSSAATVESVHIIDEFDNDLSPEYAWPTLCPGESLTLHADIYPQEYQNLQPEWSCEDNYLVPYPLTVNEDGTVTVTCTGTEREYLNLWVRVDGTPAFIRIYLKEEHDEESSAPPPPPEPMLKLEVGRIYILNEKDEDVSLLFPDLFVGESMTLHTEIYPEDIQNPKITWDCSDKDGQSVQFIRNDDGTVTITCLNAEQTLISITAQADGAVASAYIELAESTLDKLKITDEVLLKPENDIREAVYFARIENISDEPMTTRWGKLVAYQGNETIFEKGYVTAAPDHIILNPGEYAYIEEYIYDSRLEEATITSYEWKEMADYSGGTAYDNLPSEAELLTDEDGSVIIRFILSNNAEETVYPSYLTGALYDENDRLVYVTSVRLKEELGIYPGSTVSLDEYLEESIREYYQENGIVPERVDSILYVQSEEENAA